MVEHQSPPKHRRRRSHNRKRQLEKKKSKFLRNYGLQSCLVVVLLSLIPAWFLMSSESPNPVMGAAELSAITAHIDQVKDELRAVKMDGQLGKPHPFKIELSGKDLDVGLTYDDLAQGVLRAKNIEDQSVKIQNGQIYVSAKVPALGRQIQVEVGLVPVLLEGTLRFDVKSRKLGALPVPGGADEIVNEVARAMEQKAFDNNVKYESVKIVGDTLIMTGNSK